MNAHKKTDCFTSVENIKMNRLRVGLFTFVLFKNIFKSSCILKVLCYIKLGNSAEIQNNFRTEEKYPKGLKYTEE